MSVNEILSKERTESPVSPQDSKGSKGNIIIIIFFLLTRLQHPFFFSFAYLDGLFCFPAASLQQRSQIEELRKFGKEFRVSEVEQFSLFYVPSSALSIS